MKSVRCQRESSQPGGQILLPAVGGQGSLNRCNGRVDEAEFMCGKRAETFGQEMHTAPPPGMEDRFPFFRSLNHHSATVLRIDFTSRQSLPLKSIHNAAHGWRTHLLRSSQIIQGNGASKHDNREGGEPGRSYAGGRILDPHQPEQMNGSAVEAVCQVLGRAKAISLPILPRHIS